MSYWSDIQNDFIEDFDMKITGNIIKSISIDAWRAEDENEYGEIIAKVLLTKSGDICTIYINNIAKHDELAQEKIKESVAALLEEAKYMKIFCGWTIQDAFNHCDELTKEQALQVMYQVEKWADYGEGVSYDNIKTAIRMLFPNVNANDNDDLEDTKNEKICNHLRHHWRSHD